MSYILTYLRVALATSVALEILATDEIHMEDRNQICVSTALITLLPAGKTQLMEHDTPLGQGSFRPSRNPVG